MESENVEVKIARTAINIKPKRKRDSNARVQAIIQEIILATTNKSSPEDTSRIVATACVASSSHVDCGPEWSKTRNYIYNSHSNFSVEQVKRVVSFLQDVLAGDNELVCSIIQTNPRILRKSVKSFLKPTADFLLDLYGTDLLCEAVKRNPGILLSRGVGSDAPNSTIVAVEKYLVSKLGLKESDIIKLKKKAPWLFQRSTDQIDTVITFWETILQSSGKTSLARQMTLGKLIMTYPTLFNLSIEQVTTKVAFLEERCGLTREEVASLLSGSRAALFCLSVADNLEPTLELLQGLMPSTSSIEEGEIDSEQVMRNQIRKCVVKHPQILCLSQKNLKEKISYFNAIDSSCTSVKKREPLSSRVAVRSPAVYSLSLKENIIPKIAFLSGVWGKQSPEIFWEEGKLAIRDASTETCEAIIKDEEETSLLAGLLGEYPSILTLSLEGNIQPTLNFYNRTGYIHLDSNWRMTAMPESKRADKEVSPVAVIRARYIASSLFQRLLPRWHFYLINKERFANTMKGKGIPSLSLHLLSVANDMTFCDFVGVDVAEFLIFRDDAVPRLKFSSQFDTWLKTGRPIDV